MPPPPPLLSPSPSTLPQVRVWLANDHYYILSRYLVARQLTAATAPPKAARRAAAALKKALVDAGALDTSADDMEAALFGVLEAAGVPASVRATYATVARFFGARRGLAVVIAGAPWSGAPRVAARLAAALNLAAPAHTDLLSVALRGGGGGRCRRRRRGRGGRRIWMLPWTGRGGPCGPRCRGSWTR